MNSIGSMAVLPAKTGAAVMPEMQVEPMAVRGAAPATVARFEDALNGVGASTPPMLTSAPGVAPPHGAMAATGDAHPGDRILASLRSVSQNAGDAWSRMTQFATLNHQPSMADLMQMQVGAMQASVQFDYLGKIITKSTQNIDQLIKTQ